MQRIFWRVGIAGLLMVLVLAGCASRPPERAPSQFTLDTRVLQPTAESALVYYLCEWAYLGDTYIALDDLESQIKQHRYVVWEVAPGAHHLKFTKNPGLFQEKVETDMQCEANQVYYFVMVGNDRDTHKLVPHDHAKSQELLAQYHLSGWFKDGALAASEPQK